MTTAAHLLRQIMEMWDFLRLQDDGNPNCEEHAFWFDPPEPPTDFEAFVIVLP